MPTDALLVLTSRNLRRLLADGGSGNWVLDIKRARRCTYLVCSWNAFGEHTDDRTLEHGEGFLVAPISAIERSPEAGRWIVRFSRYASIARPGLWPRNRNPVKYTTLFDLGIDADSLKFHDVASSRAGAGDSPAFGGLPPEIMETSMAIALAGKYDDAIFAAFRLVEDVLQNRIGSASIGKQLLIEAFDSSPPRVDIGRPIDRGAVRDLFSGALVHIRNDRGHKQTPALPCTSMGTCISYLHFAALLLYLLSKDKALAPQVESVSVRPGRVPGIDIFGVNFDDAIHVLANGEELAIAQRNSNLLELTLPSDFIGSIEVYHGIDLIYQTPCSARSADSAQPTIYEVLASDIPLFSDAEASRQLTGVVGIQVLAHEAGRNFQAVWPVEPGRYRKGQMTTHGPWEQSQGYGDTWYFDPVSNSTKLGWNASLLWRPEVIGVKPDIRLSAITALPRVVSVEPNGVRTLNVRGISSIGSFTIEDNGLKAKWSTSNADIAFVKDGILYAKSFGACSVTAEYQGFRSTVSIKVEQQLPGGVTTFFEGLRRTQEMVFDELDNLYITNQSNRILKLNQSGGLTTVAQVAQTNDHEFSFDCITRDAAGCLYVTAPQPRFVLKICKSGNTFVPTETFAADDRRVKKDVALTRSGILVVGMMGNRPGEGGIFVADPSQNSYSFDTRDSAHLMCVSHDDHVYTVAARYGAVDVFELNGTLVDSFAHGIEGSVGAILSESSDSILLGGFHSGSVIRYQRRGGLWTSSVVATGLGTIAGLAGDSRGRIYVADFHSGKISVIH